MGILTPSPTPRQTYTSKTDPALNAIVAADIDTYLGCVITTTTTGNDQTLPSPSGSITPPTFTVINDDASTHSIDIIGSSTVTLTAGQQATFAWDGSAWATMDSGSSLWLDDGTDLTAVNSSRNVDLQTGLLKINSSEVLKSSVLTLAETTTPAAVGSSGKVYTKSDNKIYFQDGAGVEHDVTGDIVGPGSAVDEQVVVFDSTTGKLVKAVPTIIDSATGNVQLVAGNLFIDDSKSLHFTSNGLSSGTLRGSFKVNSSKIATVTADIFSISGGHTWKRTASAVDYNPSALTTDYLIAITDTSAARTVTISNEDIAKGTTSFPRQFVIKDESGGAAANNITVQGESGNIDGAGSVLITQNYGSLTIYSDGTNLFVM